MQEQKGIRMQKREVRLREQVADGAAYLDTFQPGWEDVVDLDRLNMDKPTYDRRGSSCGCVGAQLFAALPGEADCCGSFSMVRIHFALWGASAEDLGFWPEETGDDTPNPLWRDGTIECLWVREVLSRRDATNA